MVLGGKKRGFLCGEGPVWSFGVLGLCFTMLFLFHAIWVAPYKKKYAQLMHHIACLKADKAFLATHWKKIEKKHAMRSRDCSRYNLLKGLKKWAHESGLYEMRFKVQKGVLSRGVKKGERCDRFVVDLVAEKGQQMTHFMEQCRMHLKDALYPESFTLEKRTLSEGDGELTSGLVGCYVFSIKTKKTMR